MDNKIDTNHPVIPSEEFSRRVAAVRGRMAARGIDLVMAFSNLLDPSAVRYLCDFAAVNESAALILPLEGEATVCSGQASYDYALVKNRLADSVIKVFPEIGEVSGFEYDFGGQLDFAAYFEELKQKYSVKRIGIIGRLTFPAIIWNKLVQVFDGAEMVDFDDELYAIRLKKSAAEIACMRKCSALVSDVFHKSVPEIRVGMNEREIQGLLEGEILRSGAESYVQAFAPMVATGPDNSYISMCRNTLRKVQESEILNLAAGVCYEGYNGIICTPYVLGKVPQKIKDAVMCAYDALNVAASELKPGVPAAKVLTAYTDYLTKRGYIEFCPYGSLHSTGLLECEAPSFSLTNGRIIEENMTLCIDAYFKGMEWGSFRVEDCYVVNAKGAERMTTYNDRAIPKIFG